MSRKGVPFPSIFDCEFGLLNGLRGTRVAKLFFAPPSPRDAARRRRRQERDVQRNSTESDFHEEIVAFSYASPPARENGPGPLRLGTAPRIATARSGAARSPRLISFAPIV